MTISCQYVEHSAQVDELDVLVVPIMTYDLVLGLPWFQSRNPEIGWSTDQLLGLRTTVGKSGNEHSITLLPQGDGSAEDCACESPPAVYIEFLGASAFDDLLASNEVITAHPILIDKRTGLLGTSTLSVRITW
jgi:hypothetical protein